MAIVPVANALYLCDFHVGYSNQKVDLYGLFNAIRPADGYPFANSRFCVFAQLSNGLGKMPFFVDIRDAEADKLIWSSETRELTFPDRHTVCQLALFIEGCPFEHQGFIWSSFSATISGCAIPASYFVEDGKLAMRNKRHNNHTESIGVHLVQFTLRGIRPPEGVPLEARKGRPVRTKEEIAQMIREFESAATLGPPRSRRVLKARPKKATNPKKK